MKSSKRIHFVQEQEYSEPRKQREKTPYKSSRTSLAIDEGWKVFSYLLMPILIVGAILWNISAMLYSGYLGIPALVLDLGGLIFLIIGYFAIWLFCIVLAWKGQNLLAMIFFFGAAWVTGIVEYPVLVWGSEVVGLELATRIFFMANIIGVFALAGALLVGVILRKRMSDFGIAFFGACVAMFGLMAILMEILFSFLFGFDTYLMLFSIIMLVWIFGATVYDGMRLQDELEMGTYMVSVIQIFLDYVIIVIRIFIFIITMKSRGKNN